MEEPEDCRGERLTGGRALGAEDGARGGGSGQAGELGTGRGREGQEKQREQSWQASWDQKAGGGPQDCRHRGLSSNPELT